ncbi:hypothetical protein [Neptunomonas japonica]|uniref:Uncharacterized protein n=1 Tax=Neptunomonas japonica JAMM 1380 TaxID=1441457 RepID=A0A7R6PS37_9GAMM|nr:hypothetical protein [Neptunomonas japonica]BBB31602.1 conserved hypothetical protein [Neptunomonas japonica JAMM 1380]
MFKKSLLIMLLILVVAAISFWLNRDSWLADFNQERAVITEQFKHDGQAYGQTTDQQNCLDTTLQQFDGCLGFSCTVNQGVFLKACLSQAKASEGFCDGVPEYRETPTEDDKAWAKYYCWNHNIKGEGCRFLMKQQKYFCSQ